MAAKKIGALCVLDAASVHYSSAARWLSDVDQVDPDWINRRKQREIDLADAILTCSEFAADTYAAAGISREKIHVLPLGTTLPDLICQRDQARTMDDVNFVFVGTAMMRKGIDWLIDIFERFQQEGIHARLTLIGSVSDSLLSWRIGSLENVSSIPFVPQTQLFELVAKQDCLILPSRFDSFGMVVPEAMAVGVPALVSDRVGAKRIIEEYPGSGWIVPADPVSIREQILTLIRNPELLANARHDARMAAQDYTWEAYRARVVREIEAIYARYRTP